MSAEAYHADPCSAPSLSSSVAQILLRESPYKAWYSHPRLNPEYKEVHEEKFDLGTAAHSLLLESISNIVIVAADSWRTKAAKEQRDAARASGRVALLEHHHQKVAAMVKAAQEFIGTSEIGPYWVLGESEVTGIWQEGPTWLRCRFDRITKDRKVIMDYKTTEDASPDGFQRQMLRMGYHIQEAFYRRAVRQIDGIEANFAFLAQSTEPPHECTLHGCDPALQEIADADVEQAIQMWTHCVKTSDWPSYDKRIHWAMPSTWLMQKHEERLQEAA